MRTTITTLGLCLALGCAGLAAPADAARPDQRQSVASQDHHRQAARRAAAPSGGISCVPYARQVTGMNIRGNGRDWWHDAAGRYARSNRPEVGSVMAFPGSGGMRSGHVAVVSRVINSRHIEIDHANWGGPGIRRGSVMRGVSVIDVSEDNSWRQVRVQVGHDRTLHGRPYPVYGFIHNRPDNGGFMTAGFTGGAQVTRVNWTRNASQPATRNRAAEQRRPTRH
jgi:surface antigen